jgi:hypothetical protein
MVDQQQVNFGGLYNAQRLLPIGRQQRPKSALPENLTQRLPEIAVIIRYQQ